MSRHARELLGVGRALNRAIAIGEVQGAAAALALVDELDLDTYRRLLCSIFGHKVRRHRRFFVLPGRIERCERCGRRVELS